MDRALIPEVVRTLETCEEFEWAFASGAADHLYKRLDQGDLPPGSLLEDFEDVIREVVRAPSSRVYVDPDEVRNGGAIVIVGDVRGLGRWLVKVHADFTIRTAFPLTLPGDAYLGDQGYDDVGTVREVSNDP